MPGKTQRIELGQEAVAILEAGGYTAPSGEHVPLTPLIRACVRGTRHYREEEFPLPSPAPRGRFATAIEVTGETTLEAAERLVAREGAEGVCALNFASAKNPGGGFLTGSSAQEETLARSSGLYASLMAAKGYYERNRTCGTALYTDDLIFSPDVPVFRDDEGTLREEPYRVAMLTVPAPNRGAVQENRPSELPQVLPVLRRRAERMLQVALAHGQRTLILGAWGCGVFRNDPAEVAEVFADLLTHESAPYRGAFERIVFAVYDPGGKWGNRAAFEARFTGAVAAR